MPYFLGIDTSNYTTSAAIYCDSDGSMINKKKLLPVKSGECGLRQSDAVFHHVQQLPEVIENAFSLLRENNISSNVSAIGVSARPRDADGSYMPCFTVGMSTAKILSETMNVPLYTFSHQNGHIAAALYSAEKTELMKRKFIAFHISGGTTEAVIVSPDSKNVFSVELAAKTLDLNAGQLIDRIGVMLGLGFPCGKELEMFAGNYHENADEKLNVKATLKGCDCCLSGIENICRKAFINGASKEFTAALCLKYVEKTLDGMCGKLYEKYGRLPVVFAGGVMSDKIIRESLKEKYQAFFAEPEFSADNAAGTAFLCSVVHKN